MSNREIEVKNLEKSYPGDVIAVDGVSLKVEAGQIYGFLGPNGIYLLTHFALRRRTARS